MNENIIKNAYNSTFIKLKKPLYSLVYNLTGQRLQSQAHYNDLSWMGAAFSIPLYKAIEVLPSPKLTPVERIPGTAEIHLYAMEYRSIDIMLPYNEFAVCIPVEYKHSEKVEAFSGYYYLYLPVTTEDARWAGVDIYGFPKFLAEISFRDTQESRICDVKADDKLMISLRVDKMPTEPRAWVTSNFGVRGRHVVRCLFNLEGERGFSDSAGGASFDLGEHPISERLRLLEVDRSSVHHDYVPRARAVLGKALKPLLPI